MNSIHLFWI